MPGTAWPVHPEPGDSSGMRRRSAHLGKDMWPVRHCPHAVPTVTEEICPCYIGSK
jgi:ferredoxin-thioredoxin reductase catalytic subunit